MSGNGQRRTAQVGLCQKGQRVLAFRYLQTVHPFVGSLRKNCQGIYANFFISWGISFNSLGE